MPEVIVWTASEALPVKANTLPWHIIPIAFQNRAPFSSAKATSSSAMRVCCRVIPAEDVVKCESSAYIKRGGLADLARISSAWSASASAASG
jgi:hypothetical protein